MKLNIFTTRSKHTSVRNIKMTGKKMPFSDKL